MTGCRAPAPTSGWSTWRRCYPSQSTTAADPRARPALSGIPDEGLELPLEALVAGLTNLERQPDPRRGALCGRARRRRRPLREPDHARVVAEVVVAELRIAVEPELPPHRVLERPRQEVREEVRAGVLLERGAHLGRSEHVVAVLALQTGET